MLSLGNVFRGDLGLFTSFGEPLAWPGGHSRYWTVNAMLTEWFGPPALSAALIETV